MQSRDDLPVFSLSISPSLSLPSLSLSLSLSLFLSLQRNTQRIRPSVYHTYVDWGYLIVAVCDIEKIETTAEEETRRQQQNTSLSSSLPFLPSLFDDTGLAVRRGLLSTRD